MKKIKMKDFDKLNLNSSTKEKVRELMERDDELTKILGKQRVIHDLYRILQFTTQGKRKKKNKIRIKKDKIGRKYFRKVVSNDGIIEYHLNDVWEE